MGDYEEEEIIEEIVEDEPRPGLLILDMSNDQMKDVAYNRSEVVENCRQLALSDFFHVCIDSKQVVPKFRAATKGAQLVEELAGFDHLNHMPKKKDSALDGTNVLDTLKSMEITHVCVCGSSTDTSIYATVKDLVANNFDIFVVRDAISSKNGKRGHEDGLRKIEQDFGSGIIVGVEDLLGDDVYEEEIVEEEVDEEEWVEEIVDDEYDEDPVAVQAPAPAPAPVHQPPARARAPAPAARPPPPVAAVAKSYPAPAGVKTSSTMAPIKVGGRIPAPKPVAPPAANPDADRLAARKREVDAKRFADIEQKNQEAGDKAAAAKREEEERKAAQAGMPAPAPPAAAPAPASTPSAKAKAKKEKQKRRGWGIFGGGRKKKDKQKQAAAAPAAAPAPAPPPPPAPEPAPAPPPPPAPAPAPAQKEEYIYPRPDTKPTAPAPKPAAASAPAPAPKAPWMLPQEKKQFPAYTGGARTIATPSTALQDRMKGLQSGGLSMTNPAQRRMKTPKIVTDTKETWDKEGNITRHITRYITEIDGTKRTEKKTEYIPAKK